MFKNWKTTLGGVIAGLPMVIQSIMEAYANGSLGGKSGSQLLLGIGLIILGAYSKDHNVTGGTIPATPEASQRISQ